MKTSRTSVPAVSRAEFDLPALLRERFQAATARNHRYSLRSFAKQLGIDHSTLSQVMRSKRKLSPRALAAIGKRIGLSDEAIQVYAQILKRGTRSSRAPENIRSVSLDLDTFQLLSAWYHLAILELIQIKGFQTDSRWIAKTLGISVAEVNVALQRLLRLRLLEMREANRWLDKSGDAEFRSAALTETASNQINQDVHRFIIEALERVPSGERFHSHMIVALDSTKLSRLKVLAEDFLSEMRSLAAEGERKDDVYQVEVSLFPVTTLKQIKGETNG